MKIYIISWIFDIVGDKIDKRELDMDKERERQLYECALAVEQDTALNEDMENWNVTLKDGLTSQK